MKTIVVKTIMKSALATALIVAAVTGARAETIRVGIEGAYPPFNAVNAQGELHGFDVDITRALCEKMQVTCELVTQDWDGIIPALLARKYDAIVASMAVTEERSRRVAFTDPYYRTILSVAVRKDSPIADVSAGSMKGHTVGAQSSTTQGAYAEDVYGPAGADVRLYPTSDESGADLINGRLDAIVSDKFPLLEWLATNGEACCKLLGDLADTSGPISIALRKDDDTLRQRFNQAIKDIRADGTYQAISQRYFGQDIY